MGDEIQAQPLFWIAWLNFPLLWLRARLFGYQLVIAITPICCSATCAAHRKRPACVPTGAPWPATFPSRPGNCSWMPASLIWRANGLPAAAIDFYRGEVFAI